jgi:hypothetical protein
MRRRGRCERGYEGEAVEVGSEGEKEMENTCCFVFLAKRSKFFKRA